MNNTAIDYAPYMDSDGKVYVDVTERRLKDGGLIPLSFVWEDGVEYTVDGILDARPAASLKAGGMGLRFTVRVKRRETFMYLEEERGLCRWFMERK